MSCGLETTTSRYREKSASLPGLLFEPWKRDFLAKWTRPEPRLLVYWPASSNLLRKRWSDFRSKSNIKRIERAQRPSHSQVPEHYGTTVDSQVRCHHWHVYRDRDSAGRGGRPLIVDTGSTPANVVPAHLEELFRATQPNCVEAGQATRLAILLNRYANVFSTGDEDVGRTFEVKHLILLKEGLDRSNSPSTD